MKVLTNTLDILTETWDDPGDYPSNAGSGPLPSYDYVEDVFGELVFELEAESEECPNLIWNIPIFRKLWLWWNFCEDLVLEAAFEELPSEVNYVSWDIERDDKIVTLTVSDFECDVPDNGDYYEDDFERVFWNED